jgi:hypothetical protein
MFISIDGKSKQVKEIFAGGKDGLAHRIKELFGSVDGVAKLIFEEETEENGFSKFTWAEIKQLATDGLLLEHFAVGDTVTIKLKQNLVNTVSYTNGNIYTFMQKELPLKIIELTETKMRLMCPIATVLTGKFNLWKESGRKDRWEDVIEHLNHMGSYSSMLNFAKDCWGLNSGYDRLKEIDNALPDDFRDALSICARPIIDYKRFSTGQQLTTYDEDLRVRQITDDLWETRINKEDIPYTVDLLQTYYPRNKSAHFKYYNVSDDFNLDWWMNSYGILRCVPLLQYSNDGNTFYMKYTDSPEVAINWNRDDYDSCKSYLTTCVKKDTLQGYWVSLDSAIVPEMIIGE